MVDTQLRPIGSAPPRWRRPIPSILSGLVTLFLLAAAPASAQETITELNFGSPSGEGSDTARTLHTLVKVQGTGGLNQDGLYLITQIGDRSTICAAENQTSIDTPWRAQTWRYCSQFTTHAGGATLMGRNWDNQNVGSIIVSLNQPPEGYASVSFSRAIDLGFPLNLDLEQIKESELGSRLLLAPFYATDGINERGLAIAIAGVGETKHAATADSTLIFVTYLVRKILDQAATVDEAIAVAEHYVPFDLDKNSLNSHFLVADALGRSAVMEYTDHWEISRGEGEWQIMTNKAVAGVTESELKDQCWRFTSISDALERSAGRVNWGAGLRILRDAAQQGTTWSVAYGLSSEDIYFTVYQHWDIVYHLSPF